MKMRVEMEGGEIRTVEMEPPMLDYYDGERLDRVTDANGIDHFFTKDGYYDGWGAHVSSRQGES